MHADVEPPAAPAVMFLFGWPLTQHLFECLSIGVGNCQTNVCFLIMFVLLRGFCVGGGRYPGDMRRWLPEQATRATYIVFHYRTHPTDAADTFGYIHPPAFTCLTFTFLTLLAKKIP